MVQQQGAGVVAVANEEAVRAWDTVLYERWKSNREVFVGALGEVTEEVFGLFAPPEGGRCIDVGCGFGETTQRLAELGRTRGASRSAPIPHRGSSRMPVARPQRRVSRTLRSNSSDAQTAEWDRIYDYAFSRMGTQFFAAPVPAMRAIRGALEPGGRLAKVCWRRKAESPLWAGDRAGR